MKGLFKYRSTQFVYCVRRVAYKFGKKEHLPLGTLPRGMFNDYLIERIVSGEPLMVARFGSQEARATAWSLGVERGYDKAIPRYVQKRMAVGPGFFPADDTNIQHFGHIMVESARKLDALAYWDSFMQQYLLEEVCPVRLVITRLEDLEPYRNQDKPWSSALQGRKVLVVHPFAATIESQYHNRAFLFENPNVLPDFELKTLVPPQTIAGSRDSRFDNWFQALAFLEKETDRIDFDVAIIGCGAYGFPLAAHVKETGRQAVHLGGATQMLFGIKGRRWDLKPISSELYNDYWVRPGPSEKPANAGAVEDGCYW